MDVPADGRISPPDLAHIYRVNGLPEGATWLAAHALSGGGEAPGNAFLTFAVGDRIEALGASWRVTERWTAGKGDANAQGPLAAPQRYTGHLVLVTCLPLDGGSAVSNTWVVAQPIVG
ncbi:hypothetical protein AB1K56_03350 [Microbacterium sp. BWR-S6Y]|uniref:hypothetical protein n=1 Tax=Microbacterium sp. BWR-S6Y TaxID=3232073 RepID=UPI003527AD73